MKELPVLRPAPFLVLVVPCYNEEATLPDTMKQLAALLDELKRQGAIRPESLVCYVDDGSSDSTWNLVESRHETDQFCRGIKFAANAGHQNAVWAGMETARDWDADCVISLDADLQDDISVVPEMIDLYCQGDEIVYGIRNNRATDTAFKRGTARLFYALLGKLNLSVIPDHADYRLVGREALQALKGFGEHNLFLRGLFPVLGFRTGKVYYRRLARQAGKTNYPLKKMLAFAWQGITSCSVAPLRIAGLMGLLCMLIALAACVFSLARYLAGETIQGWTSLIIVILFIGSAQLFSLAVIGEYIAKIYTEVRGRPRYIVEKCLK